MSEKGKGKSARPKETDAKIGVENTASEKEENQTTNTFEFNYKMLFTLFASLAPVGYLIGFSYHQGALNAYGVSSEMFEISTYMTYVYSFYAVGSFFLELGVLAVATIKAIANQPFAFIVVVLIVMIGWVLYRKILKWKIWEIFAKRANVFAKKLSLVWVKSDVLKSALLGGFATYLIYVFFTVLIAVALAWWALPMAAYQLGALESLKKIETYEELGCCAEASNGFSVCSSITNSKNEELIGGLMVTSSSKYIAFYNKDGAVVQEFPKEAKLKSKKVADTCTKTAGDASSG